MGFHNKFLIIGHRGAAGLEPENTLASFQRAFQLAVDAVELDVHLVESELVVIHDRTVDRTTNGRGEVGGFSLKNLQKLNAGDGQPIPLLNDVFKILPSSIGINIELKGAGTGIALSEQLSTQGAPAAENLLVSSFDHSELTIFHASKPEIPCAPIFSKTQNNIIDIARNLNAWSVNLSDQIADTMLISELRDSGFRVLVHTINDVTRSRELASIGASGVFTDYPDRLTEISQIGFN